MHFQLASKLTNEKERAVLEDRDVARLFMRSTRESFGQGYGATSQDGRLMCLDYGFRIEEIRHDLPVHLWYGKDDTYVPLNHGQQIAARLGGRADFRALDETHASIWTTWRREVLKNILESI
jgi:pimeloyl-ACP methyl ester carboxylesterase